MPRLLAICLCFALACSSSSSEDDGPRLKLWHTFNPTETEALNKAIGERAVTPTVLPFARAQTIIRDVLVSGKDCPDLVRIDATWLPGLARASLLQPVPQAMAAARTWLPEAAELARDGGRMWGLPQALDGLVLIRRRAAKPPERWPPKSVDDLVAGLRKATASGRFGLGVRTDGYWFVAFLRAWGGGLVDPAANRLGIDAPVAEAALTRFAALFGENGISPPPSPSGGEADAEARRFRSDQLAVVMSGPWAITDLAAGDPSSLEVAPFPPDAQGKPAAPRGGQLLVVPKCAGMADRAWKLALELTAPKLQSSWSRNFGVVPTTQAGLAAAGPLAAQFYAALKQARPLPRHPMTPALFDDLNPAIAAVIAGDATAREALDGVARGWLRMAKRRNLVLTPHRKSEPTDGGVR